MKVALCAALCAVSVLTWAGTSSADPEKDESGKGHEFGEYAGAGHRYEDYLRARDASEQEYEADEEDASEVGAINAHEPEYVEEEDYVREAVEIPPGHLPPPGKCRDWYPDLPAGHQPPPYRC